MMLSKIMERRKKKMAEGGEVKTPPPDPHAPDPEKAKGFMSGFGYAGGGEVMSLADKIKSKRGLSEDQEMHINENKGDFLSDEGDGEMDPKEHRKRIIAKMMSDLAK